MFVIYCVTVLGGICFLTGSVSTEAENITSEGIHENTSGTIHFHNEHMGKDMFRSLLNQETLIRMALVKNVNSLMQDMVSLKSTVIAFQKNMVEITNNLEKITKISMDEIENRKLQNKQLKNEMLAEINQTYNQIVLKMQDGILELQSDLVQHKSDIRSNIYAFQKNSSTSLTDLEANVRIVSLGLVTVDKQTQNLTKRLDDVDDSLPQKINGTLKTVTETMKHISEKNSERTNNSLQTLRSELEESNQNYLRLSANVLSLEWYKNNSSGKCGVQKPVAFTSGLTVSSYSWSSGILIFDKVLFNQGNGYDPTSGEFTAPADGVYVFYISLMSYDTNNIKADIYVNGNAMVTAWGNGDESEFDYNDYEFNYYNRHQTGTNMAITSLKIGDKVWVQHRSGNGVESNHVPITTFSGFLI